LAKIGRSRSKFPERCPPDPLASPRDSLVEKGEEGRGGEGKKEEGREMGKRGRGEKGEERECAPPIFTGAAVPPPLSNSWRRPCL